MSTWLGTVVARANYRPHFQFSLDFSCATERPVSWAPKHANARLWRTARSVINPLKSANGTRWFDFYICSRELPLIRFLWHSFERILPEKKNEFCMTSLYLIQLLIVLRNQIFSQHHYRTIRNFPILIDFCYVYALFFVSDWRGGQPHSLELQFGRVLSYMGECCWAELHKRLLLEFTGAYNRDRIERCTGWVVIRAQRVLSAHLYFLHGESQVLTIRHITMC